MSYTFKNNTPQFLAAFEKATENGLTSIGMTAERHAKHNITTLKAVDTGRLRNSITFAISGKEANTKQYTDDAKKHTYQYSGTAPNDKVKSVYLGTNVEYAKYVEVGTSKMRARPFLRPAVVDHMDEYNRIMAAALKNFTP